MHRTLAAALLSCVAVAALAGEAQAPEPMDELAAFLDRVQSGSARTPQRFGAKLPAISSRSGRRTVEPTLDVVAGRLDADTCLYQLRLELRWSGAAMDEDEAETGGRSLIQKAPCATLVQEVLGVAGYEISALERRLRQNGRFAINREREQVISAARQMPLTPDDAEARLAPVAIDSRTLPRAPAAAPAPLPDPAAALVVAAVGTAHVAVREQPSLRGRVVGRLKPGTQLRLLATDVTGWFALEDGAGFIPAAALQRLLAAPPVSHAVGARVQSAP